jgi:hypothetical protein
MVPFYSGSFILWALLIVVPREVPEGANELRLILCRKTSPGTTSTSVVSACGIYVSDILDAVPIDKYFELFKPVRGTTARSPIPLSSERRDFPVREIP